MKIKKRVGIAVFIFALLILGGSLIYQKVENWNLLDSIYFTTMTVTTVGYGDIVPKTEVGKVFTIVFAIGGIAIVLYMLSIVGRSVFSFEFRNKLRERKGVIKIKKAR